MISSMKHLRGLSRRSFASAAQPALTIEFPGVPSLKPASAKSKPETKLTTLSNGLRVASEDIYGQVSTLGVFVDAGSRYETYENHGVSHLLEHMAFKSTDKRSHLRIVRDMEEIGATVGAASSRECIMYTGECLRGDVDKLVETMAETVLQPKLAAWDVDAQREVIGYDLENFSQNAQSVLTEILHAAAFGENSALGRSLWCPERNVGKLNGEMIAQFMKKYFQPNKIVLAGANIDHDRLVGLAEKFFTLPANYQGAAQLEGKSEKAQYTGGSKFVESDSEFTHVAIGFNPGSWTGENLIDVCTLHFLLGGGGSFSAGGPGKGMYSRLYQNVLNRYHWVDSAIAFNTIYNDAGLFGIYGSCPPKDAGNLLNIFCEELESLTAKTLSDEEVARAKNQLKSSMLMKLESRQVLFEDIGRQILTYGKRETPEELCRKVDAVSASSLKKAATAILKTKPTIAGLGNTGAVPKFEEIAKRFAK